MTSHRRRLLAASILIADAALATILTSTTPATAAAPPCGFWTDAPSSYYTHCVGPQDGNIWIRVERGSSWWQECVPPGTTKLDGGVWGIGPALDKATPVGIACFDPGLMIFKDGRKWHRR